MHQTPRPLSPLKRPVNIAQKALNMYLRVDELKAVVLQKKKSTALSSMKLISRDIRYAFWNMEKYRLKTMQVSNIVVAMRLRSLNKFFM